MKTIYEKVKTREQIAAEYGVSPRTLRRWLKNCNIILPNRLVCPKEQRLIYNKFGYPMNPFKNSL
ncbi:helix-turn-helix domain-containing protein [Aestuariivivens sediminis]|uniref:helix-turn-helix domain-containing protein n=1 Tax=Aestuariivivens sediminis TaxID=2913557 RepID=UPI003B8A7557